MVGMYTPPGSPYVTHLEQLIDTYAPEAPGEPVTWLEYLEKELDIIVNRDGELVSLKYDQLNSPMDNPIVQECRGIVVHVPSGLIQAHGYNKFWNYGDTLADEIDWASANVLEKLDGSLMQMWNDGQRWQVSSSGTPLASGSFGSDTRTFKDAFWETFIALHMACPFQAQADYTFCFELCDTPNRVVVIHDKPRLVLHGARNRVTGAEVALPELQRYGANKNWEVVKAHPVHSIEEALAAAAEMNPLEQEGFVVVDKDFHRVKIKCPRYVALHHMKGMATPRRAIELWQAGGDASEELLRYFPEMAVVIQPVHALLDSCVSAAVSDIHRFASAPTRKEYAALVKELPWSAACFRYYGANMPSRDDIKGEMQGMHLAALERMLDAAGGLPEMQP